MQMEEMNPEIERLNGIFSIQNLKFRCIFLYNAKIDKISIDRAIVAVDRFVPVQFFRF